LHQLLITADNVIFDLICGYFGEEVPRALDFAFFDFSAGNSRDTILKSIFSSSFKASQLSMVSLELELPTILGAVCSLPEQRTALLLKSLDHLFQFLFRRLDMRGHTCKAHHPFNLPMDEFLIKSNFISGKLLFVAVGTIDLFLSAH
jgi:hypothetical protein